MALLFKHIFFLDGNYSTRTVGDPIPEGEGGLMDVEGRVVDAWCSTSVLSLLIVITNVSGALHICVPIPLTNKISHHDRVIQEGVIVQRTFRETQHNPLS